MSEPADKLYRELGIAGPIFPSTPGEFTTVLAHYHRAEIARMAGWRDRIDRTSNWAITVVAAMLSVSLSTPTAYHGVLLFAMLLLLVIEARRYRFFDVYRNRVRGLERNYYAQIFAPRAEMSDDWMRVLGEDLRRPLFMISLGRAISRRLRRNYCWMFLILLLAWLVRTSSVRLSTNGWETEIVHSFGEWLGNSAIGPVPGPFVILGVAVFYAWVAYATLRRLPGEGELAYGDVHV